MMFNIVTQTLLGKSPRSGMERLFDTLPWLLPEVAALRGVQQTPDYHPEGDAYEHTMKVISNLTPSHDPVVALAALLHDVGKATTSVTRPDGRIQFPRHADVGAWMAQEALIRLNQPHEVWDSVYLLVLQHMKFFDVMKMRPTKLKAFVTQSLFPQLLELHRLDKLGGSGDMQYYNFAKKQHEPFKS
jgi:poly(A) polymerase